MIDKDDNKSNKTSKQNNLENIMIISTLGWITSFITTCFLLVFTNSWYVLLIGFSIFGICMYFSQKTNHDIKVLKANDEWSYS